MNYTAAQSTAKSAVNAAADNISFKLVSKERLEAVSGFCRVRLAVVQVLPKSFEIFIRGVSLMV